MVNAAYFSLWEKNLLKERFVRSGSNSRDYEVFLAQIKGLKKWKFLYFYFTFLAKTKLLAVRKNFLVLLFQKLLFWLRMELRSKTSFLLKWNFLLIQIVLSSMDMAIWNTKENFNKLLSYIKSALSICTKAPTKLNLFSQYAQKLILCKVLLSFVQLISKNFIHSNTHKNMSINHLLTMM